MNNEDLIKYCFAIDQCDISDDPNITERTKKQLKSLLISGCDMRSDKMREHFPDEYCLFLKLKI